MNKKLVFNLVVVIASMLHFTSCDKVDGLSVVPRFDRIDCDTPNPAPGDTITLTAHQSVQGHLINKTTYTWSFQFSVAGEDYYRDSTFVRTVETNYDGIDNGDPVIGFRIPKNISSHLNVSLRASYNLSGSTAEGQIYGEATRSTLIRIQ